ncbi:hypothetical protein HOLDEFILI_01785 [Holdemania filiformis DSM 12042]|uniref:Uncharacterized protein n=1 Tax=Holdemania filiformis DSM 12042 TaxID=545696 RepID=B9Y7J0_9FIRM|nr:hypothetical protein HOLDEFILI_01785 [Holdemania filiformis DSM 12042]
MKDKAGVFNGKWQAATFSVLRHWIKTRHFHSCSDKSNDDYFLMCNNMT